MAVSIYIHTQQCRQVPSLHTLSKDLRGFVGEDSQSVLDIIYQPRGLVKISNILNSCNGAGSLTAVVK